MDESIAVIEAVLNILEDPSSRTNTMNVDVDECQRMQEDQNERRAAITCVYDLCGVDAQ